MGVLSWVAVGFLVGVLAKWALPGADAGGVMATMLIGVGGAIAGGMIGTAFGFGSVTGADFRSALIAIGGAVTMLYAYRVFGFKVFSSSRCL